MKSSSVLAAGKPWNVVDSETPSVYQLVLSWMLLPVLLYLAVRGAFSFQTAGDNNGLEYQAGALTDTRSGAVTHHLIYIGVYLLLSLIVLPAFLQIKGRILKDPIVILLPSIAVASVIWSQAPALTFGNSLFAIAMTFLGIYLAERFNPEEQIDLLMFLGWTAIILSLFCVVFLPSAGIEHVDGKGAWQGIFVHKNHCGIVISLLLLTSLCIKKRSGIQRLSIYLFQLLGGLLVVMSQSRTGWILLGLSLLFNILLSILERFRRNSRIVILALTAMMVLSLTGLAVLNASRIALLLGKDPTMTGRTEIWTAVGHAITQRPLLGYGYRAFWTGLMGPSAAVALATNDTAIANAENGILEIGLDLGAIGIFAVALIYILFVKKALACIRCGRIRQNRLYLLILFTALLGLVDGDKIMYPHTIEWVLFVMAYIGLSTDLRRMGELSPEREYVLS